jgi:hypothetical protein
LDSRNVKKDDLKRFFPTAKIIDWTPTPNNPAPDNWQWEFWDSYGCGLFFLSKGKLRKKR